VDAPGVGGEALEEDEALAVEEVVAEDGEALAEVGEGEVGLQRYAVSDRLSRGWTVRYPLTWEMPVRGVPLAMKLSEASPSSASSSSVNQCVHFSGAFS
jgi:hypothetical protein